MQYSNRFFAICTILVPLILTVPCAAGKWGKVPYIVKMMTRSDSLLLVGEVRLELGETKSAVDPLLEAVRLDPNLAPAHATLGSAYLGIRKWKEAKKAFQAALALDPNLAAAHDGLGLVAIYKEEDAVAAQSHLEAALALAPDSAAVRYHLGLARLVAENRDLKKAAKRVLKRDSMDAAACRIIAEIHASKDEWDRAIGLYERIFDLADGDVVYRLALLYLEAGRYEDFKALLQRVGNRSDERRWMPLVARAYLHEGDGERARAAFQSYIERLDAGEQERYRDISLVASRPELDAYAKTSGAAERAAFLDRFWIRHDLSLVTGGALRQAEHDWRVWYARTHFSKAVHPWDRRGEVYIRYGEPDYRATSKKLNADPPPQVQRIKERMAVELYGLESVGEFYTGPVYPVRSNRLFSSMGVPENMGLTNQELALLMNLDELGGVAQDDAVSRAELADGGRGEQQRFVFEAVQEGAAGDETADIFNVALAPEQVRNQKFVELTTGLWMPVTIKEDASVVPWEAWVYTMVAEGFEVTFTDEFLGGNYDYAPVPLHVSQELTSRYMDVRDVADFLWHSPALVLQKMAGRIPDFHDFARGAEPLDFWYRTASFRGKDGRTRLEVYCGIPPDSLLVGQGEEARIERSVALVDPTVDRVYRSDRDLVLTDAFLRATADTSQGWQNLVLDAASLEAPPGTYEFGVRVRERGKQRFQLYRQQLKLEDYSGSKLQVSDVELAWSIAEAEEADGDFVKHGLKVMPMTVWTFPQGHPAFLYFEIYNLARDKFGQTRYRVTYDIRSKKEGGTAARVLSGLGRLLGTEQDAQKVSVTYDQVGGEIQDVSYVELNLDGVGTGDQEVQVTVKDLVEGGQVSKTTVFGVR